MKPWMCSVRDTQTYNGDMWGLREIGAGHFFFLDQWQTGRWDQMPLMAQKLYTSLSTDKKFMYTYKNKHTNSYVFILYVFLSNDLL